MQLPRIVVRRTLLATERVSSTVSLFWTTAATYVFALGPHGHFSRSVSSSASSRSGPGPGPGPVLLSSPLRLLSVSSPLTSPSTLLTYLSPNNF